MGEIADMMLDGFLDYKTGEVLDGDSPGYPRTRSRRRRRGRNKYKKSAGNFKCEKCGRHFKSTQAVADHVKDMHTQEGQERRQKQILGL